MADKKAEQKNTPAIAPPGWTDEEITRVGLAIKIKAMKDPKYRALALSNPNAAIAEIVSTPVPAGFTVRFIDNAGANYTLVLPDPVARVDELSDAELEQVAGGRNNNVNNKAV
jgi:hypothetical protein